MKPREYVEKHAYVQAMQLETTGEKQWLTNATE